jgi:RAQPRD family integrative conjugative element protein
MTRFLLVTLLFMPVGSIAQPASIESSLRETELAALARLEHELELLKVTIDEAQAASKPSRLRFDYERLRLDLEKIRLGLREHRAGELRQPRAIEPMSGEYIRD